MKYWAKQKTALHSNYWAKDICEMVECWIVLGGVVMSGMVMSPLRRSAPTGRRVLAALALVAGARCFWTKTDHRGSLAKALQSILG